MKIYVGAQKELFFCINSQPIHYARARIHFSDRKIFDAQKRLKEALKWQLALSYKYPCIEKAVQARFVFVFHYKKRTGYHIQTPDVDNLTKFYLDILQGIVLKNDKQVSILHASKIWGLKDCVIGYVQEIGSLSKYNTEPVCQL